MDKIEKIQESRERLLNDLYASVRYTPDPQTDLVAMMAQYIKEEPENRPPLLEHIRHCMDGEPYPNPYADPFSYSEREVDQCGKILDDYAAAMEACDGSAEEIKRLTGEVTGKINRLNEACGGGLIDTWRRDRLCEFINGTAELAGAKPGQDMTYGQRMW